MEATLPKDLAYIKGIGPKKAEVLQKELQVKQPIDLLFIFPFRYIDKTQFQQIKSVNTDGDYVLLKGKILHIEKIRGKNNRSRLTALLQDDTGMLELVWFQSIAWIEDTLHVGKEYIVFGRITIFNGKKNIAHPEYEAFIDENSMNKTYEPVYNSTDKLEKSGLDNKSRRRIVKSLLDVLSDTDVPENLPEYVIQKFKFPTRIQAICWIHFPKDEAQKKLAQNRIKFEEFFFLQLQMLQKKGGRHQMLQGIVFDKVGDHLNRFYKEILPFELTNAQKRVLKEIRADLGAGHQMNRLLQGDVGSGKTVVALMTMLLALDNGCQAALMAPTEILASQHYKSVTELTDQMGIRVEYLSGSVKGKRRNEILTDLQNGLIHILIGTHALLQDHVVFQKLGISIIDEQHRFGVAQRAQLWKKNVAVPPHILVMTATPIPRTLAMTIYGDLDVSIIDELPPGRKEIKTIHKFESHRPQLLQFMHAEIAKGRQIYIVYPLIEESEKLDLQNLQEGYERLLQYFPMPEFQISVVHGRMKAEVKEFEMQRFIKKITHIMVATTVIEVGVNVPNASVMVVENAERFGLSQLHQLRGRVGRGADQSYCILMSGNKLSTEARQRLSIMVRTANGFEIAEADLHLRGPGDIEGLRQSGVNDFKMLNLAKDTAIISAAREAAERIIEDDVHLESEKNHRLKRYIDALKSDLKDWGRIS